MTNSSPLDKMQVKTGKTGSTETVTPAAPQPPPLARPESIRVAAFRGPNLWNQNQPGLETILPPNSPWEDHSIFYCA